MRFFFERSRDTPLVSFHITNRVGTSFDPLDREGLVSHTAELGFRGSGPLEWAEFDERVDNLGAALGVATGRDYLSMHGTCLSRHINELFDLALGTITQPRLRLEDHEQLLRETRYELDDLLDDDVGLAHSFFQRFARPGYRYCRTALGTHASLEKISLDDIRETHRRLFRAGSLTLGMSGDIEKTRVAKLSEALPAGIENFHADEKNLDVPVGLKGRRLLVVDKPSRQQCQVVMGHLVPAYGSEVHDRLLVAETAFGGMFSSRLMQEIRVKEGWSYEVHCGMGRGQNQTPLAIALAPNAPVCAAAIERTLDLYAKLSSEGLDEEEFEFTRSYLQGSSAFERATANQRIFRAMQDQVYNLPDGYSDGFSARLDKISNAQIKEACAAHLSSEDIGVVVVATASDVLPSLERLNWRSIDVKSFDSN